MRYTKLLDIFALLYNELHMMFSDSTLTVTEICTVLVNGNALTLDVVFAVHTLCCCYLLFLPDTGAISVHLPGVGVNGLNA